MAELGQTNDPAALIPGDTASIYHTESSLKTYGELLHIAGDGLRRIDTTDGWSGEAADAFRKVFHGQPGKWTEAGDAFHSAANALDSYASTLSWAQRQAAEAISLWNSGEASHQAAQDTLATARGQLDSAGNTAATTVGRARDLAPPEPGFWSQVGDFFCDLGHDAEVVGEGVVNTLASLGNAAVHHPGDLAAVAGGLLLAGVSGIGDGAGLVLDATGVGAIGGLPLNAISTAGVVTGLGIAGVGMAGIAQAAAGPDRVNMMNSDSGGAGGGGGGGGAPRSYSSSPGGIAQKLGYSPRQINEAIHAVKNQPGWRGLGDNRNPDVVVDTSTGEVYPKLPDGNPADDSIGNIFDHLPEN